MLKSGQIWHGGFATIDGTGALSAATVGPVGVLYVDGAAMAEAVTISGANPYAFEVTLPVLSDGQTVKILATATVGGFVRNEYIASDTVNDVAQAGDAMSLTSGERTTLAGMVWNVLTSALTAAGSIGKYLVDWLAAIKAKTDLIVTGGVTVTSPVLANGDVEVTQGDEYLAVDSRRLEWEDAGWNIAASSTIVVIVFHDAALAGVRISATKMGVELTGTQSAALAEGEREFYVQEIKSTGGRITHQTGTWTTKAQPVPTE